MAKLQVTCCFLQGTAGGGLRECERIACRKARMSGRWPAAAEAGQPQPGKAKVARHPAGGSTQGARHCATRATLFATCITTEGRAARGRLLQVAAMMEKAEFMLTSVTLIRGGE